MSDARSRHWSTSWMMPNWRRRACARAGTSRPSRHIWSACSPTASGCSSGRRSASGGIHRAIDELARRRAAAACGADRRRPASGCRPSAESADHRPVLGTDRRPGPRRRHPDPARPALRSGPRTRLPCARLSHRTARVGFRPAQTTARALPAGQRYRPVAGERAPRSEVRCGALDDGRMRPSRLGALARRARPADAPRSVDSFRDQP